MLYDFYLFDLKFLKIKINGDFGWMKIILKEYGVYLFEVGGINLFGMFF